MHWMNEGVHTNIHTVAFSSYYEHELVSHWLALFCTVLQSVLDIVSEIIFLFF